ncbi:hypothetical protein [Mycolicibacterium austroafricanum]|nr:hypothetical protein [Mycolicibacterium austroafricanum]
MKDTTPRLPAPPTVLGDRRAVRVWFGQLVLYSMTVTLAGAARRR